jgi:hypothetical protein
MIDGVLSKLRDWLRPAAEPPADDVRSELGYEVEDLTGATGEDEPVIDAPSIDELQGTVELRKERELVIAISVVATDGIDWTPRPAAEVQWDSAKTLEARVDGERSTGKGRVEIGQTVRVSLVFPTDLPPGIPTEVWLVDGARRVCIRVG